MALVPSEACPPSFLLTPASTSGPSQPCGDLHPSVQQHGQGKALELESWRAGACVAPWRHRAGRGRAPCGAGQGTLRGGAGHLAGRGRAPCRAGQGALRGGEGTLRGGEGTLRDSSVLDTHSGPDLAINQGWLGCAPHSGASPATLGGPPPCEQCKTGLCFQEWAPCSTITALLCVVADGGPQWGWQLYRFSPWMDTYNLAVILN